MEFPSFSNRYVSHRPLPPFPSDHHRHHRDILHRDIHHLPPPPFHPPPPPPPLLYPPLPPAPPPPPPFNPHQSNFTFLSHHHSPPRVSNSSNRTLFRLPEFDKPYPPPRPDSWSDPPRVSPYRPTSPDFELNSRSSFRDEFPYRENRNDNQNQSQRLFWDRIGDDIDNDNYRYKFGSDSHNSSFTREIRDSYESRYGSVLENERFLNDNRDENRSWGSMDMEHNGEFVSARRERDIYDSGRFSNRDRDREREEREDFFRTPPKKQIQKKSVLLRIGKPNDVRNNRSHEQHFGSFRGKEKDKDPIVYSSQTLEEERERSPVDLDVSFKSNALVAKAIAAAHSSPARSFTPRNRKVRKVTMSDSPQKRFAEHSVKSGNSIHESDCPSSSEKTPKNVENVTVSGNGSVVNDSAGKSAVKVFVGDTASDEGHKRGGSGEAPSYRIRKNKKVASLSSPASNLKSVKKDSEPVTVDSSMNTLPASDQGVMHLEEQMTSAVLAIKCDDVVSLPSGNVHTANKDESPAAIASEMDNSEINSRRSLLLDFNRNSSTHLLDLLSPPETEINEGAENVCGSVNTYISNSDMVQAEFQDGSTVSGIGRVDEVSQQSSQNGKSILHENGIEGSSEGMVVGIGNGNAILSTPQENKIPEGQVDLCMAVQDAHNTAGSVFGFKKQENITIYNIDLMDVGSKESSSVNEASNLLDSGNEEAYLNAADNCVGGHGNLDLSKTEETTIHEGTMNANSSYYAPSSPSSSNTGFTNCQGNKIISNKCILDETSNQACLDGVTMIHENTVVEEYQKAEVLTRDYAEVCSEKDYTPNVKRKRTVGDIQLDLSSPRTCDTHLDVVSSALDENTTLSCSVKDLVPTEMKDDSCGAGNLHDTSQSCKGWASIVHGSRVIEASYEVEPLVKGGNNGDSNGASPMFNKKRKVVSPDEKIVSEGGFSLALNSSLDNFKVKVKSDQALVDDLSVNTESASSPSQDTHMSIHSLNPVKRDLNSTRKQLTSAVPRVFTGPSTVQLNTSKRATPSNHSAKSRTWHRTDSPIASVPVKKTIPNPVHAQRLSPRKVGKVLSSSYIRKGNSLVRKPAPVSALPHVSHASSSSVCQLNPSARDDIKKSSGSENKKFTDGSASWLRTRGRDEVKKSSGSESRVGIDSSASCLRTGGSTAPSEMPKTPLLPHITKSFDCATTLAGDFAPSLLANTPSDGCSETTSVSLELTTNVDIPKISEDVPKSSVTSEYQIGLINDLGRQGVLDDGNSVKKITYVKRKSNQLIATSNANDMSGQDVDKTQASSSDSYYKRRKNQLIRASLESYTMPRVVLPDNTLSSEAQRISRVIACRSLSKRQFGKAITKMHRPSKFSLVWRLSNPQSPKKDAISLQRQKERSHLFPWKRAAYWQSSMHDSAYSSNNNSLSSISRKLLLTRKRDTIYTRSKRGFSLRISKLLSVGGSSLKWSKSIEKNSKRANEEATLAVAAVQRKKREQTNAPCAVSGTKSRNHFSRKSVHSSKLRPGERVFRIGSARYKMDPTRRTLQRISEEEASCSSILESEKNVTKSYVPRRLLIGNNEYVRIGNGNQLIRDPKKRTRTLASEKVRWSLHTARLRSARKSKYCQFFTRFGKCNKDDGKCPYIHDPAKIAVCTKFLNGSCSNPNCELTHKVIPERMQDCSYYLQGLCSNENCPYRHVNVNANTSICEGFLKGYCADGNECRKKHTYVCPIFEATGICPQGSKCKLHHPKKRSKGTKRKSSREQKNAQGRYFGSRHVDAVKSRTAVSEKLHLKKADDIFCQEGKFSDYISVDISDEEDRETIEPSSSEQITLCDRNLSVLQVADPDELTRPISIMYKIPTTESSPAVDSVGGRTGSYISEESNCCEVRT